MLSLLMFYSSKQNLFSTYIENQNTATRQGINLCLPQTDLNIYQKLLIIPG